MKIDLESLRELYQGYAESRRPQSRKSCPSPLAIAKSLEPSASIRKKKRIVDHLSECAFCREEFTLLFQIQRSDPGSPMIKDQVARYSHGPLSENIEGSGYPPFWRYACVVLGLSLAVSSFFLLLHQKQLSEIQRAREIGLLLSSPKPGQVLSAPFVFQWQRDPSSEYYVVELFDEALLPVWTSDRTSEIRMQIPLGVYARLRPEKPYFWMVTAFSGDSETRESELSRFVIRH
jgi:hypothetical protein